MSADKIVYDCLDFPANSKKENDAQPYLDDNDLVELP